VTEPFSTSKNTLKVGSGCTPGRRATRIRVNPSTNLASRGVYRRRDRLPPPTLVYAAERSSRMLH
jgi:hypothetical protein